MPERFETQRGKTVDGDVIRSRLFSESPFAIQR
jgi:hypothetical protein